MEKENWFVLLSPIKKREVLAVQRDSDVKTEHPTKYDSALDFFLDMHEIHKFIFN